MTPLLGSTAISPIRYELSVVPCYPGHGRPRSYLFNVVWDLIKRLSISSAARQIGKENSPSNQHEYAVVVEKIGEAKPVARSDGSGTSAPTNCSWKFRANFTPAQIRASTISSPRDVI
jgi:hypothetical protein